MDPAHARHPATDPHGLGGAIEEVYRAVDHEVGEMLAAAGEDTVCMVVAAHGMGPLYHASWNLQEMLDLLGHGRAGLAATGARAREGRVNPWRIVKMVVPGRLQYGIKAMLPPPLQDRLLFLWYAGRRRWEGCRAFAIPNNDAVGAIRISVKGRDRHGLVEPGSEYDRLCDAIAEALGALTDPVTGRSVVQRVTITRKEFEGPFLDQLPDLTVLWEQSFPWQAVHSPAFGTLRLRRQDGRSASHRAHGFVLAAGPGVPGGRVLVGHSIYDIAPTVLRTAGVAVPDDLDGRPLPL
jgi:predicted AlkP superfamily phosphohydrolase/phosphomutase